MITTGQIRKMRTTFGNPIQYSLVLGNDQVALNEFIGKNIQLVFQNRIECVSCGAVTKKSFGQGFCYACFMNAPDNSPCIIRPELCEAHLGKGRDVEWEHTHHNCEHYVYLALSAGVKVGVTRFTQVPTRWIDQGASSAILLAKTPYRQLAGEIEVALKEYMSDKTNWQKMLKNEQSTLDLLDEKEKIMGLLPTELQYYVCDDDTVTHLNYPVLEFPMKVTSTNFEKSPMVAGNLRGIKGQYLLFDGGKVLNVRAHSGYVVAFEA